MGRRDLRLTAGIGVLALIVGGCAAGFMGQKSTLRPTNVEVRILSQSSFQGEIEPCG
jgi:hypothetical protein